MTRTVVRACVALGMLYLTGCIGLGSIQRSLLYHPQPASPVPGGATEVLPVEGQNILVTVSPHEGDAAVIYLGGNAENAAWSLPTLSAAFPGRAIYLLHYRGYAGSTGTSTEEALQSDALVLFDRVHARHPSVTIIGRSLGSGIAVRLAAQRPVSSLILVTPYNSMLELAEAQFPYLPVSWLLEDKYESWRYAGAVEAPVLLIAAEHDSVVPLASTRALYARFAPGRAILRVVGGADHHSIVDTPQYLELLRGDS